MDRVNMELDVRAGCGILISEVCERCNYMDFISVLITTCLLFVIVILIRCLPSTPCLSLLLSIFQNQKIQRYFSRAVSSGMKIARPSMYMVVVHLCRKCPDCLVKWRVLTTIHTKLTHLSEKIIVYAQTRQAANASRT